MEKQLQKAKPIDDSKSHDSKSESQQDSAEFKEFQQFKQFKEFQKFKLQQEQNKKKPQQDNSNKQVSNVNNINQRNMQNIQFEILRKKRSENPYFATHKNVVQVITDYDELPYKRWYRGIPESDVPIIAEREAGYRPLSRKIYLEEKNEYKSNNCADANKRV